MYTIHVELKRPNKHIGNTKINAIATNAMRFSKKDCYNKILEDNKNNIKAIWDILNSII